MIETFDMPPLASGKGLCDIDSIVQSYNEKFRITILYRYHIAPARWLVEEAHEMPKLLNLSYL